MTSPFRTDDAARRIVEETLGQISPVNINVTPYLDHADEPALSIGVSLKSVADIPGPQLQSELTHGLRLALSEHGDHRFPYLYFDAPVDREKIDCVEEDELAIDGTDRL